MLAFMFESEQANMPRVGEGLLLLTADGFWEKPEEKEKNIKMRKKMTFD